MLVFIKLDDLKLLKSIHERAATLQEDISETIPIILKEKDAPPVASYSR